MNISRDQSAGWAAQPACRAQKCESARSMYEEAFACRIIAGLNARNGCCAGVREMAAVAGHPAGDRIVYWLQLRSPQFDRKQRFSAQDQCVKEVPRDTNYETDLEELWRYWKESQH